MGSNAAELAKKLDSTINNFTANVNVKVDKIDEGTAIVKQTATNAYNEIKTFKKEMIENEQMQSAKENILRINQILRERFSNYDDIRRTVMGVVKDFDVNLVRNKTITELSEELWISSSRYWLAYTLIAISAWINDNKDITDSAVKESYRVDEAKTSLFFCIMNLRFGRTDVAAKWLVEYFNSVVPDDIQDETAILIQSYINGVFGVDKGLEIAIKSTVDKWMEDIKVDEQLSDNITNAYAKHIANIEPGSLYKSNYLSKYCLSLSQISPSYLEATKYDKLIKEIKDVVDIENIIQNASNFKQRVDNVLKDLITKYDADELEVKREQEYFQLIIDNKGNEELATKKYQELLSVRNKKNNIADKCVEWALYNKDVDIHVKKFGFQTTSWWYKEAIKPWATDFENKFPTEYKFEIDKWAFTSNGDDAQEQEILLRESLEQNKFKIKFINKLNIILAIATVLFMVIGFAVIKLPNIPAIVFAVLGGVALIVLVIRCLTASKRFNKKVNDMVDKLRGCMAELTELRKTYFANKDKKAQLINLIDHFN